MCVCEERAPTLGVRAHKMDFTSFFPLYSFLDPNVKASLAAAVHGIIQLHQSIHMTIPLREQHILEGVTQK